MLQLIVQNPSLALFIFFLPHVDICRNLLAFRQSLAWAVCLTSLGHLCFLPGSFQLRENLWISLALIVLENILLSWSNHLYSAMFANGGESQATAHSFSQFREIPISLSDPLKKIVLNLRKEVEFALLLAPWGCVKGREDGSVGFSEPSQSLWRRVTCILFFLSNSDFFF